ncbi:dTDP-glucose 4,6-dehydratase [Breznakia blatticola]|uniref:dTDP-glucose 4,6-dehydratase n=1 Tax=Breznakia blatticola TaxID=1754012 RepID=A0A4R7Z8F8_9FIRM|nr:dTDP-glucose 4,6-dehydratase [Breznakia blatticola]TDW09700.1 dTDP-glucose 4,6-dehydratase [Breznakia blatticola]
MIYLITGGAGFMGSNFLLYMIDKYPSDIFINVDKLTYASNKEYLKSVESLDNYIFIKGDICNKDLLKEIFQKYQIDCVVNFAAESHVDNSIENPESFFYTNIIGTSNLLEYCRIFNVKKYHQISTDEVYGDVDIESTGSFSEVDTLNPNNPYSASKASADLICLSYYKTFGLSVTISRSANNMGPNQNEEKLIPKIINNAIRNKPIPIYGYGTNVRDWIYVDDHSSAVDLIIQSGVAGNIYNVSAQNPISNIKLAMLILNKMNKQDSLLKFVEDRKAHDEKYAMNTFKIQQLGWRPKYSFKNALERTITLLCNQFSKD